MKHLLQPEIVLAHYQLVIHIKPKESTHQTNVKTVIVKISFDIMNLEKVSYIPKQKKLYFQSLVTYLYYLKPFIFLIQIQKQIC